MAALQKLFGLEFRLHLYVQPDVAVVGPGHALPPGKSGQVHLTQSASQATFCQEGNHKSKPKALSEEMISPNYGQAGLHHQVQGSSHSSLKL